MEVKIEQNFDTISLTDTMAIPVAATVVNGDQPNTSDASSRKCDGHVCAETEVEADTGAS